MLKGDTTPPVFCAKLTQVAEEMKHIAVVVEYKNGNTHVYHTAMTNGAKAWFRWIFDTQFRPTD